MVNSPASSKTRTHPGVSGRALIESRIPALLFRRFCTLANPKQVAVTYDDGPTPGVTERLLASLDTAGIAATFFMPAVNAAAHRRLVRECVDAGHECGCHAQSHHRIAGMAPEQLRDSLREAKRTMEDCTGKAVRLFRPPHGWWNPFRNNILEELGLALVMWSCMPGDYRASANGESVRTNLMRTLHGGGILVMHDNLQTRPRAGEYVEAMRDVFARKQLHPVLLPPDFPAR